MPKEIIEKLKVPDLWFDFYSRLLPGTAFVILIRMCLLARTEVPDFTEIVSLLLIGYFGGLFTQPVSSILTDILEKFTGDDYIRQVQKKLGTDSREAMILSKMHGETSFFVQLAVFSFIYFGVEKFWAETTSIHLGNYIFISVAVSLAFAYVVSVRRRNRARKYDHNLCL